MAFKEIPELKSYLTDLSGPERDAFATLVESSAGHLRNISYGYKRCAESLAISIERESRGAVRCEQLRPDVDWAFLRGTSGKVRQGKSAA